MAYQISYGPVKQKETKSRPSKRKLIAVIAALVLVVGFRLSGLSKIVGQWLLPGDREVTATAFETMSERMEAGDNFGDAFACFCQEIIENANIPE